MSNDYDDNDRLVPKPHLIKSIRSRNWNLSGAIEELIDNSIGHGKATDVDVLILNGEDGGIGVFDNGIGVDDINRIFRLGDASAHDDWSEIGQYGVGATDACIYLGDSTKVVTIRDGWHHEMGVNWRDVEKSGLWPKRYKGLGRMSTEIGTQVHITKPAQKIYRQAGSERLAAELGTIFAPGLRNGVTITVIHRMQSGERQRIEVVPFNPADLTKEVQISGEVIDSKGRALKWSGRAGLSASLTEKRNGVHVAFAHRIIEMTRDAFNGESAPTLYCEVTLDATTPWKHTLSDHKDKVVKYRDELMASIGEQLAELLAQSAEESQSLALANMTAPIEMALTSAMLAAGVLHVDPDEGGGGTHKREGEGHHEDHEGDGDKPHTPVDEGDEAEALEEQPPTGIKIHWRTKAELDGKLWGWDLSGRNMVIKLDKEEFGSTVGWPPKFRERHVVQLVATLLSHAIEKEWLLNEKKLNRIITAKLRKQIAGWVVTSTDGQIAPYVNRAILEAVVTP